MDALKVRLTSLAGKGPGLASYRYPVSWELDVSTESAACPTSPFGGAAFCTARIVELNLIA
jgi:hypothetical protein